jgi:hypothetical protein
MPHSVLFTNKLSPDSKILEQKRRHKEGDGYWLSPHAGQIFSDVGIFAPHSTQYLITPLSSLRVMLTDLFCIDIYKKQAQFNI